MPQLTLDAAAALLVQLDPANGAQLRELQRRLADVAGHSTTASAVLVAASRCLSMGVGGSVDEVMVAVESAGELIERAMLDEQRAEDGRTALDSRRDVTPAAPLPEAASSQMVALPEHVLPADTDLDLLQEFVTECRDLFDGAEAALLTLEVDPDDAESINTVFRAFHTIKGTSAFFGLEHVSVFAHHAETLLSGVRDRTISYTSACADLALRSTDMLKVLLALVRDAAPGSLLPCPDGYESLVAALDGLATGQPRVGVTGSTPSVNGKRAPAEGGPRTAIHAAAPALEQAQARDAATKNGTTDASVRVRTDRLDRLIDMVGELVIAQAMLSQDERVVGSLHHELGRKVAHAGKIVRELQDLTMSMRMVPLKSTFQKMARLTRDVAHRTGKQVEFIAVGDETEIDRNMVDVIGDPLVHMVRNAVDHGIELPEARDAAGKRPVGVVRLSAYHAGGNVVVELRDDGKGLDRDRIVRKALALGLIESEKGMTDAEIFQLIFAPGFSTNEVVTDLSGRGVGMDVVRRNIEALRGRVEIASEAGAGTAFTIRLPLTLAITDGMSVQVGAERYIIPTLNIQLSFRPASEALFSVAGKGEMVLLRDDLMPIVRLHRMFGVARAIEDPAQGLLVVVGAGDGKCALLVDELLGQQQVVAKPLGDGIGRVRGVSGGAILGDGRVGLILDVAEVVALSRQGASGPQLVAA